MNTDIDNHFLNHLRENDPDTYLGVMRILNRRDEDLKKGCHDIMNILSLIAGNYQLLAYTLPSLKDNERFFTIGHDIENLTGTMNAIGQYRYADSLTISDIDTYTYLMDFAGLNNDIITAHISTDLPHINADSEKLRYILNCLIDNILDADAFAMATLTATFENSMVKIAVTDTLPEFDKDAKARLFAPFNTCKKDHAGMSLATSYKIMAAHGGSFSYKPEYPNGSTFTLWFPVH